MPTAIQELALPLLAGGRNAYLGSETGTGKTLAYLLPILAGLDPGKAATQAIVVAPTHELAIQIHRECGTLAQDAGLAVRSLLLVGGTSLARQLEKLKTRPHVVVGSPGRILELIHARKLKVGDVKVFVVDEADRLLAAEGLPDVRAIVAALPNDRQMVFASATEKLECSREVAKLAPEVTWLRPGAAEVNEDIAHRYLECEERDKPLVLRQALHATRPARALVFAHLNETAERIAAQLAHHGVPVAELHAGLDKFGRKRAMEDFRSGRATVLVASDVAARGLDVPGITHVFNLDAPSQGRDYLHRAGRTGRAGAKGEVITLVTGRELRLVRRYERELKIAVRPARLHHGRLE